MRVLLLSANREKNPQPVYPLGLEYIRQACIDAGFDTRLADCNLFEDVFGELREMVVKYQPHFVLISVRNIDNIESIGTKFYLPYIVETVTAVRNAHDTTIVMGGSGYSLFPKEILRQTGADYGVKGAGEFVIGELLQRLHAGLDVSGVAGLVYRKGDDRGEIIVNDQLLPSAFGGALQRSRELVTYYWQNGGMLNVQLKRGCPFQCVYCTYPGLEGRVLVERNVEQVLSEIEELVQQYGVNQFFLVDSVFNIVPETTVEFAEAIIRRGLKIKWTGFFSPKGVSSEIVRLWKASGLASIEFGVDALSGELLRTYDKSFTIDDMRKAADACSSSSLPYSLYLIFGGPGETVATVEETIRNCESLDKAVFIALTGMRIYPNTPLYKLALQEGVISPDQNLLVPRFYISAKMDNDYLERRMEGLSKRGNWLIIGHGLKQREKMAALLRKQGDKGSLWERCVPG